MSARILLVDGVATNRIVLNVKLIAARYLVDSAAGIPEALTIVADTPPDLILMAVGGSDDESINFCRKVKSDTASADTPIIMIGTICDPAQRLAALRAGADDVICRPVHDQVLLARIRSLLRARDAAAELRMRDDTHRALGLGEPAAVFETPGRVAILGRSIGTARARAARLGALTPHRCSAGALDDRLGHAEDVADTRADVVLIDGTGMTPALLAETLPPLVSELRSRSGTRDVGQIAVLPDHTEDTAAILLDIGVNDVVAGPVSDHELALRVEAVMARKKQRERLRQSVRDGLRAAVTDPLTGLYNRRYAEPHLLRLARSCRDAGSDFAMMVLDIDHFKSINDAHGHGVGDRVLVMVAERLRRSVRAEDLVARIGGEEFLVAMPDTDPVEARAAAERLRTAICSRGFDLGQHRPVLSVTLSVGVAMAGQSAYLAADDPATGRTCIDAMFERADAALYRAKNSGRNMVNMALSAA